MLTKQFFIVFVRHSVAAVGLGSSLLALQTTQMAFAMPTYFTAIHDRPVFVDIIERHADQSTSQSVSRQNQQKKNDALIEAVDKGDTFKVISLLKDGANPESVHGWNEEPVMDIAAGNGHTDIVGILLAHGADINGEDKHGKCWILWAAVVSGHYETAQYLIAHGANPYASDMGGETLLYWALQAKDTRPVKLLLKAYVNSDHITHGGDALVGEVNSSGDLAAIKALLDYGVSVNATNREGYTALIEAAKCGCLTVTQFLLSKGARVNIKAKDGMTALKQAQLYGSDLGPNGNLENVAVIRLLKRAGAKE